MNESTNTNQPIRPDFSGPATPNYDNNLSGPTPLNTEGFGLNNQPTISSWSPGVVPIPGPLNEVAPLSPVVPNIGIASSGSTNNNPNGRTNIIPPVMSTPVPSPSAVQYEIKTLASDAEALRASGGAEALPQTTTSLPNITQDTSRFSTSSFVATSNPVSISSSTQTQATTSIPAPVSASTTPTPPPAPVPVIASEPIQSSALNPVSTSTSVPFSAPTPIPISPTSTPAPAPAPTPEPAYAPTTSPAFVPVPSIVSESMQAPSSTLSSAPIVSTPTPASLPASLSVSSPNIIQPASIPPAFVASATNLTPQTFSPSSMGGEEFFNPTTIVAPAKKKGISKIVLIIGSIIVLIGFGILIVLFALPLLRTTPTSVELTDVIIPPVLPAEATPPLVAEPEPALTPVVPVYTSFFSIPANFVERPIIENITLESLKQILFASLRGEPARAASRDKVIREVIINSAGVPLVFSSFLPIFLPDINAEKVSAIFEDNFTLFVHENRFIGFIAQTKIETTPAELTTFSTSLEASPHFNNLYATDPGVMAVFREGTINGNPVRQTSFSAVPGQNLHYGWFRDASHRNYLIVSISYEGEGIIEAVRRARLH